MLNAGAMTRAHKILGMAGVAGAMLLSLGAATKPSVLARAGGGLWEIDRVGPGQRARLCLPDPNVLASLEHRGLACTRVIVRELPNSALVHYTCTGGGFGQSQVTAITPRSLRIETQGIAANAPFQYTFQARRVGNCAAH